MFAFTLSEPRINPRMLSARAKSLIDELGVVTVFADKKGNRVVGLFRERHRSPYHPALAPFALLFGDAGGFLDRANLLWIRFPESI